jgi:hypothetical protein
LRNEKKYIFFNDLLEMMVDLGDDVCGGRGGGETFSFFRFFPRAPTPLSSGLTRAGEVVYCCCLFLNNNRARWMWSGDNSRHRLGHELQPSRVLLILNLRLLGYKEGRENVRTEN